MNTQSKDIYIKVCVMFFLGFKEIVSHLGKTISIFPLNSFPLGELDEEIGTKPYAKYELISSLFKIKM